MQNPSGICARVAPGWSCEYSYDGTVKLWNHVSDTLLGTYDRHSNAVNAIAFSHDGKKLVLGGEDMSLHVWHVARSKNDGLVRETAEVTASAIGVELIDKTCRPQL